MTVCGPESDNRNRFFYMLHFPLDYIEGTTLIGDIDATVYNNPVLVDGIRGKALSFNGRNQYADLGDQT